MVRQQAVGFFQPIGICALQRLANGERQLFAILLQH
jgi:hypothetical protein